MCCCHRWVALFALWPARIATIFARLARYPVANVLEVTHQSNRMGYRLDGPALIRRASEDLKSHAVFPGVIQVPAGGAPIVLMADAPATGGYPRIASVIAADQWRLAQVAPGKSIQFELCTRAEALLALRKQHDYLQQIRRSLRAH